MNIHAYMESIGLTAAQIEAVSKLASVSQSEYLMEGLADFGDDEDEFDTADTDEQSVSGDILNSPAYPALKKLSDITAVELPSLISATNTSYAEFLRDCLKDAVAHIRNTKQLSQIIDLFTEVKDKAPELLDPATCKTDKPINQIAQALDTLYNKYDQLTQPGNGVQGTVGNKTGDLATLYNLSQEGSSDIQTDDPALRAVYPALEVLSRITDVQLPDITTATYTSYAKFLIDSLNIVVGRIKTRDKLELVFDIFDIIKRKAPGMLDHSVVDYEDPVTQQPVKLVRDINLLLNKVHNKYETLAKGEPVTRDTSSIPDVVDTVMQDTVDGVGRDGMTGRYNQMQTGNVDDIGVDEAYQEEFGDTIANMDDTFTNEDDEFSDDDERTEKYTLTTIQELYPILKVFIGVTNAQRYPDDTKKELQRKTDNELATIYAGLAKFSDKVENTGMGNPKMPHKVFVEFIEHPNAVLLDKATERINRALRNCIASYQGPMGSIKRTLTNKQKDLLDSNDVPYDIRESLGFSAKSLSDGDIVDGADTYDQFMSAEENKPTEKTVSGDNADFWKALGQEGREVITSHDRAKRLAKEALARRRNAAAMKQGQQLTESIEDDDDVGTIYDDYMNDLEKRNAGRDPLDFEQNVEREYLPEDWKENDEPHANELPDRDLDPKSVQATNLVSDHFDTHARSMDREDVNNMDAFAAYCGQPGVRTDAYRDRTKQIAKRSLARVLAANKAKALHEATDELEDITTAEPANSYLTNRVKKSLARAANAQKTRRHNQDLDTVMGKHGEGDFGNYREMLKKSYLTERQH